MLRDFWFVLIAVLWAGFFVLEGFDFGVGMLLPYVGRDDVDRQVALSSIGPVWDGNEVWLITAGGAMFAAFPEWYASLFSGFYLALFLVLVALIVRGISVEYRGKAATAAGRAWCDRGIVAGGLLPPLLFGVAFANMLRGVEMRPPHQVTSSLFDLLNPYALVGGLALVALCALHGATFLALKTRGPVGDRAGVAARRLAPVATVLLAGFLAWTGSQRSGATAIVAGAVVSVLSVVLVVAGGRAVAAGRDGWAFVATAGAMAALVASWFVLLFPDVLPVRGGGPLGLTITNAASSPYTLRVMTVVALIFTPIVLAYQAWSYWIFRKRITRDAIAVPTIPAPRAGDGGVGVPSTDEPAPRPTPAAP